MTRTEYRQVYASLLDDADQRVEASYAVSLAEPPLEVSDSDREAFRAAVAATQERAAHDLPPLRFDAQATLIRTDELIARLRGGCQCRACRAAALAEAGFVQEAAAMVSAA